jgi:micrococcal nuclease
MDSRRIIDGPMVIGVWPICAAILFALFALLGDGIAAILIAVSGLAALPSLRGTFRRYGATESSQFIICLGAGVVSGIIFLANPNHAHSIGDETETYEAQAQDEVTPDSAEDAIVTEEQLYDASPRQLETVLGCRAIDGDTLICGRERVRLLGIDAPEMPGHCLSGRNCVQGDPFASQQNLQDALQDSMSIERIGNDRYGRTLGMVYSERQISDIQVVQSLSCIQLVSGHAFYVGDWDDLDRVASECGPEEG